MLIDKIMSPGRKYYDTLNITCLAYNGFDVVDPERYSISKVQHVCISVRSQLDCEYIHAG